MVIAGYRMMTELIKAPKATPAAPTAGSMCNSGDGDALTAGMPSQWTHTKLLPALRLRCYYYYRCYPVVGSVLIVSLRETTTDSMVAILVAAAFW
jgi:hypothetical protein